MNDDSSWPKPRLGLFAALFLLLPGAMAIGLFLTAGQWLTPVVTSAYDTYADAVADDLFDRGWLPDFIPASATRIVTVNNLDINISEGRFRFDRADRAAFLARLRPLQSDEALSVVDPERVAALGTNGYRPYEFAYDESDRGLVNTGSVWVFFVHEIDGFAYYEMGPR